MKLHEHPFASYCWKALIAFYEVDLAFERVLVEDRTELAKLWPLASIPVLEDGEIVIPESTAIIEYAAPALVTGLEARLWDRLIDGHVETPMQKIVGDRLRAENVRDPEGVGLGRAGPPPPHRLLRTPGGTAVRRARDRGSAPIPGELPTAVAGLRAVALRTQAPVRPPAR